MYHHLSIFFLYKAGICPGRKKEKGRSWTVSVLCLSDKNCSFVPNSEVKEYLLKAGLGMKKIRFNVKDGQTEVLKKISSDEKDENDECIGFPALKNCGGFELMRSQANNRSLSTIEVEWSVKNLKACIGSQGKLYVRPGYPKQLVNFISTTRENHRGVECNVNY